jgi:uncharacterized paraquat-inducible protein A
MTDLPPNPYTATNDAVETRSTERTFINGTPLADVIETITVRANGAREVTRLTQRTSATDGRVPTDKTAVVVCDTCHHLVTGEGARACSICRRIVCGRCIHRVHRNQQLVEVCSPCRWHTLLNEFLRLS